MEYTVTGGAGRIDFAATGVAEVLQNIRMILTTPIFTVPLDREFGIDWSLLDNPMPAAQTKLTAQVFSAIRKYEPRASVVEIDFLQGAADMLDGKMIPRVRVEVDLDATG